MSSKNLSNKGNRARTQSVGSIPRQRAFVRGIQNSRASELRLNMRDSQNMEDEEDSVQPLPQDDGDSATARRHHTEGVSSLQNGADLDIKTTAGKVNSSNEKGKGSNEVTSPVSSATLVHGGASASTSPLSPNPGGTKKTKRLKNQGGGPIYGRAYEKHVQEMAAVIAADEQQALLTVDDDDLQMLDIHRERRTAEAAMPSGLQEAPISMLARQSLMFYQDDWHVVKRKHIEYSRTVADDTVGDATSDANTIIHDFAIDHVQSGESGLNSEVDGMPTEPSIYNVAAVQPRAQGLPVSGPPSRLSSGTLSEKSKKHSKDQTMLPPSKWKRRLIQLRFQTSGGPLVLEMYKDEKRQQVTETVNLTDATVEENGTLLSIRLVNDETIGCNFDKDSTCSTWAYSIRQQLTKFAQARARKATTASATVNAQAVIIPTERMKSVEQNMLLANEDNYRDVMREGAGSSDDEGGGGRYRSIFSDYPAINRLNMPAYDYVDEPHYLRDYPGAKFTVTCEELLFKMNITSGKRPPHNVEPFFGAMALYDLRCDEKISETFYFDLNTVFEGFKVDPSADIVTKSREAVFTVDFPHSVP